MINVDVVLHIGDSRNLCFWWAWLAHIKGVLRAHARARLLVFCADEEYLRAVVPKALEALKPDVFEYVPNKGADSASWLHYLELHLSDATDYCLKLHTKKPSAWTYMLLQPFVDLPAALAALEEDRNVVLAGRDLYLQPLYFGVSEMYRNRLQHELLDKFGVHEEGYTDPAYLREINRAALREWSAAEYRDRRPDVARACISDLECRDHFALQRREELIHAQHDVAALQGTRRVFVAGNIYIARGRNLRLLKAKLPRANFRALLLAEPSYHGNFDQNGSVWRWANALEYLTQAALLEDKSVHRVAPLRASHPIANWTPSIPALAPAPRSEAPRVLFVSHELTLTGAPLCLLRNIRSFARRGWRLALISDFGGEAEDAFGSLCENVWILSSKRTDLFSKERGVAALVQHWRPDLVFLNSVMTAFALRPAACAHNRPRLVAHIHESAWDLFEASNAGAVVDWDDWGLCDRILCVNDLLQRAFVSYAPTVTVHNDVDLHDAPLELHKSYVAGSGTLDGRRKGFDIFCEVAESLPHLSFKWAGRGRPVRPPPENVEVLGLPQARMRAFWAEALCFLCTSRSEAFPLAVFEAQCAGTQVILSGRALPVADLNDMGFIVLPGVPRSSDFARALQDFMLSPTAANATLARSAVTGNTALLLRECEALVAAESARPRGAGLALTARAPASIHSTFPGYCLAPDLVRAGISGADEGLLHYLHHGFAEGRSLARSFCPFKPVVLFALHASTLNGATLMGLDIASELQQQFSVQLLIWGAQGSALAQYSWEFPPLTCSERLFEHDRVQYYERVEAAKALLEILKPDLVYVNCSVISHLAHAALWHDVPVIVHHHDSTHGYRCQLSGSQVPGAAFHAELERSRRRIRCFAVSDATSKCMKEQLGIPGSLIHADLVRCRRLKPRGGRNDEHCVVGMIGERTYRKGFDIFCALAQKHALFRFVWVGDPAPEWPQGYCDCSHIPNLELVDATVDATARLVTFSVLLCTSRSEACPLVVVESLAAGVPTVIVRGCVGEELLFAELGATVVADPEQGLGEEHRRKTPSASQTEALRRHFDVGTVVDDVVVPTIEELLLPSLLRPSELPHLRATRQQCQCLLNSFQANLNFFDPQIYVEKYGDIALAQLERADLERHWFQVGHARRNCRRDDWPLFCALQDPVDSVLSREKSLHQDHGAWRGTHAPFSPESYVHRNPDVAAAFGERRDAATLHFLQHGLWEGRCAF